MKEWDAASKLLAIGEAAYRKFNPDLSDSQLENFIQLMHRSKAIREKAKLRDASKDLQA